MADHVIRYVVTHINKDGMRTLCGPAQGQITRATPEEAQSHLDDMMKNNPVEGKQLAGVFGLPLEVRPVKCYPGHFDPIGIYFEHSLDMLTSLYIDAASELHAAQSNLGNTHKEMYEFVEARDALREHPAFPGTLPKTYFSGGDLDPEGVDGNGSDGNLPDSDRQTV